MIIRLVRESDSLTDNFHIEKNLNTCYRGENMNDVMQGDEVYNCHALPGTT
jgi:hypothetical protein